ncbi:MAG TPA: 4-alpha-glucanotransferase [Sphingobium sp.]
MDHARVTTVRDLADLVGLAPVWQDATGQKQQVSDDALAAILCALGYPAEREADRLGSHARIAEEAQAMPAFLSGDAGKPIALPAMLAAAMQAELATDDGPPVTLGVEGGLLDAVETPGYYRLRIGAQEMVLAIAPPTCPPLPDRRIWGPAVQIPGLRDREDQPFGHFGTLASSIPLFATRGADAVAISPVHALFPGDGRRFSPYAPSSRLFRNAALADPALAGLPGFARVEGEALIDWPAAIPPRLAALRAAFAAIDATMRARIHVWVEEQGEALCRHALHDALHLHFAEDAQRWQDWPAEYHDPDGVAVRRFAALHRGEVSFHLFLQWLAAQNLETVQAAARAQGMDIGLIADLAVGIDPGGSDAWAMRGLMLDGLTIGAPPDPLGPDGQNWGLTSFSPQGLRTSGFAPWIAMLRAALAHAGGLRIDHGFGLQRLWGVPEGGRAQDGAYLDYPRDDLLRLLALEAHRANAVVIAEDLGTWPPGFREAAAARGLPGMRVLWFEREEGGAFRRPEDFDPASVAMTGTHDTPTVAGWWIGRDLDWNDRLSRDGTSRDDRAIDRMRLWTAIGEGPQPAPNDPLPVVDAALAHIGRSASRIAIVPLEDLLGEEEQPNLPGTTDEHPNWRRRLSAPLETLIAEPETEARIAALDEARKA